MKYYNCLTMNSLNMYKKKQSIPAKMAMFVSLPIFAIIAGVEHLLARLTGTTYTEVNIVVYYLLIPLSWMIMLDYIIGLPLLTPVFLMALVVFLWKDHMTFRSRCVWLFSKAAKFLLCFRRIGWNYVVSSVIICVVIPLLIYIVLICATTHWSR